MGNKSEARAARKASRQKRFEESKKKLIDSVSGVDQPKYIVTVNDTKQPQISPSVNSDTIKTPKATKDGSRFGNRVTWCISQADKEGKWSWHELRAWTDQEWAVDIEPPFIEFTQMTWADVDSRGSGSGHKMHHEQVISTLINCCKALIIQE